MSLTHPTKKNITLQPATLADATAMAEILVLAHLPQATVANVMGRTVPREIEIEFYAHNFRSQIQNERGFDAWKIVDEEHGCVFTLVWAPAVCFSFGG